MSASEVAKLAGITRQGIANLEAGAVDPAIKPLEKLFVVFGLTAAELVDLGSTPPKRANIQLSEALAALQRVDPEMLPIAVRILTVLKSGRHPSEPQEA